MIAMNMGTTNETAPPAQMSNCWGVLIGPVVRQVVVVVSLSLMGVLRCRVRGRSKNFDYSVPQATANGAHGL
jgi:predicted ATP-dependent Lon-type protease